MTEICLSEHKEEMNQKKNNFNVHISSLEHKLNV